MGAVETKICAKGWIASRKSNAANNFRGTTRLIGGVRKKEG
jgi:hypothetical protein